MALSILFRHAGSKLWVGHDVEDILRPCCDVLIACFRWGRKLTWQPNFSVIFKAVCKEGKIAMLAMDHCQFANGCRVWFNVMAISDMPCLRISIFYGRIFGDHDFLWNPEYLDKHHALGTEDVVLHLGLAGHHGFQSLFQPISLDFCNRMEGCRYGGKILCGGIFGILSCFTWL